MYPRVVRPRKATDKWLKQMFAPLEDYLNREYPDEARRMMADMTFFPNEEEQQFIYRNRRTKHSIILDRTGRVVSGGREALQYPSNEPEWTKANRAPRDERFIHPNVTRWIERSLSKREQARFGEEVIIVLQELWGPIVNFDFDDLRAGCPIRSTRTRYCLCLYPFGHSRRLVFQFIGDEIAERSCSPAHYAEFQERQNRFTVQNWRVINILREMLDERENLDLLRRCLAL
jgi:hypothetical protein